MALATIQQIRDGQGSRLDSLSDTQIQLHLDDAEILVLADGIPVDNVFFSLLQRLKCYDALESTGSIPNEVNSETVGDVSIGMDTNIAIGSATFYSDQYTRTLIKARGSLFVF
jgi:hypothetical protein